MTALFRSLLLGLLLCSVSFRVDSSQALQPGIDDVCRGKNVYEIYLALQDFQPTTLDVSDIVRLLELLSSPRIGDQGILGKVCKKRIHALIDWNCRGKALLVAKAVIEQPSLLKLLIPILGQGKSGLAKKNLTAYEFVLTPSDQPEPEFIDVVKLLLDHSDESVRSLAKECLKRNQK